MGLIEKVVKSKRLQRISGSLAMIIPDLWLRAKGWTQQTEFMMEFHPGSDEIIITAKGKVGFKESMTHKGTDGECQKCAGAGCEACSAEHLDGEKTGESVSTID